MILSARLLRGLVGEQSKFGAFFSGHPRWETREQRIRQDFGDALAAFRSRWPDAHDSLGGAPPPIVETGVAIAVRDKGTSTLSVPIWSRNIDTPVQVFVDAGGIRTVRDFAFDENMYMRLSLSGEQLKALEKAKTGVRVTAVQGTKTLLDQTVPFEVQQSRRKK